MIAKIQSHTGVPVRSPAIWLEHGRARHALKTHGNDAVPVTKADLKRVPNYLEAADGFRIGNRKLHNVVDRVEVSAPVKGGRVTMIFEARRRGLTLHTMYKKGKVQPA